MDLERLQNSGEHLLSIFQDHTDELLSNEETFEVEMDALTVSSLVLSFVSLLRTNPPERIVLEMDRFVSESGNWAQEKILAGAVNLKEVFKFNATLRFTIGVMGAHIYCIQKGSLELSELCQSMIDAATPIADKLVESALVAGK